MIVGNLLDRKSAISETHYKVPFMHTPTREKRFQKFLLLNKGSRSKLEFLDNNVKINSTLKKCKIHSKYLFIF